MAVTLIVVLGLAVIISAVAAERSARARRRLCAVCLNLVGIVCLALGLLGLCAWCRGDFVVARQVTMATAGASPAAVAQWLLDARPAHPPEAVEGLEISDRDAAPLSGDADATVQIDYDARPAWVDRPARDEGAVHQVCATAGPFCSQAEAEQELNVELKRLTDEYINDLLGSTTAARWIEYDLGRIRRTLVASTNYYNEKVISPSVGEMVQSHALLEFGPEFRREIAQRWHQIVARARLVKVALAAAALLGSLALLLSYFQVDTATRGFYTGRLKLATFVAILGLIVSGVWLARSIPWLWP